MAETKILIVDDEREFVFFLKNNLTLKGYSVDAAYDGEEALELIKSGQYDAALLDHNMPGLTGLEIGKYVKKKNIKTKVIMITGYEEISEEFAKAVGVDDYLTKPVSVEDVENIIKRHVDRKKEAIMKKILIIDDEINFGFFVKKNLELRGDYEVVCETAAEKGVELAKEYRPDLILLDIIMQKMDGLEALKALKENAMTKSIPVIMLTARSDDETRMKALNLGNYGYIVKPFGISELEDKIEKALCGNEKDGGK
jgi:DNA-binding response OmpR family regulator